MLVLPSIVEHNWNNMSHEQLESNIIISYWFIQKIKGSVIFFLKKISADEIDLSYTVKEKLFFYMYEMRKSTPIHKKSWDYFPLVLRNNRLIQCKTFLLIAAFQFSNEIGP